MNNPTRSERNKFFQPLFNINCIIPALKQEGMSNISISNLQPLDQVNSTKRGGKMMMETRPVRCSQRLRHSSTISLPDSSASRGQTDHNVQPPTKKIKIEPKDEYQDVKIKQETEVAVRCYNIAAISLSQRDKVTIDNSRLSQLLEQLLDTTKEYPISTLETMYSQLNTCIFSFQDKWNRNELPNELETIIRNFNKDFVVTSQSDEE
ncbi:hypothetical protein L9F63_027014 [Diploptera punctata]|uniref:Uncharacterized protein n=1 Tax=Diploptera punctata TaxID=6984 RepID=A0AAD8ADF2_DIPPU|nr:hypothetical protein L9F63_027014 [Diploptera punctata]